MRLWISAWRFSSEISIKLSAAKLIPFCFHDWIGTDLWKKMVEFASRDEWRTLVERRTTPEWVEELILSLSLGNVQSNMGVPHRHRRQAKMQESQPSQCTSMKRKPSYPKIAGTNPETYRRSRSPLGWSCFAFDIRCFALKLPTPSKAIGVGRTQMKKWMSASLILYLFDMGDTDLFRDQSRIKYPRNPRRSCP